MPLYIALVLGIVEGLTEFLPVSSTGHLVLADHLPGAGEGVHASLDGLEHVTPKRALIIGLGQCASLWPGTSRSMATIIAGQLTGLSTATAAEFSFLVALPALGAATVYEGLKARHELLASSGG